MSNKPPIGCFNGSECIYNPEVCRLYEDRTEECRLENLKNWLKETTPQKYQAGKPVEIDVTAPSHFGKVATPTTPTAPFDYATMYKILEITQKKRITQNEVVELVKGEMAKAAGLLTSEAAAHLVSANLGLEEIEVPPPKRVATPTTPPPQQRAAPKVGAVVGKVVSKPINREAKTQSGPKAVTGFNLDSGEETVKISLWERPDLAQLINMGDEVTLEGLKEGEPYDGMRQFSGGKYAVLVGANVAGIAVPQEQKVFVIKNPNAPATEAQINQLNKMGIKNIAQNITKQQASDLISSRMKK